MAALYGDESSDGASAMIANAAHALEKVSRVSDEMRALSGKLNDLMYTAQDIADELRDKKDDLTYSADELEQIEERLDTLHKLRKLRQPRHRRILAHQREHNAVCGELILDEVHHFLRVQLLSGENEVTYQHTGAQNTVLIHDVRPGLAVHLAYGGHGDFGVVRRGGVAAGKLCVRVLEIGHIDLHKPLKHTQRLDAVIAGAVPDDGDAERKPAQRLSYLTDIVTGRDEIYIVYALVAQAEHRLPKLRDAQRAPAHAAAYLVVLAKDTSEVAAGEKYGARTARTADAWLLAEVRRGARDAGQRRTHADAEALFVSPVSSTAARTVITYIIHNFFTIKERFDNKISYAK